MVMPPTDFSTGAPRFDYSAKDFEQSPLVLFYELTQACDLVCQHCRACAQPKPDPHELTLEQSLRLIDQIAEFPKPPLLVLTGGDPLKRKDIFSIVEYAANLDLKVAITPSATPLATVEAIQRLKSAGIARMAISLDGANPESHDGLRGVAGSFEKTLEILQIAQDLGISSQVNTTVTKNNWGELDQIADLIAPYQPVLWSVFFLVPVGRGTVVQRLDAAECEQVFEVLWQQAKKHSFAIKTTEAPHYRRFVLQKIKAHKREATTTRMSARIPSKKSLAIGVNDGRGAMFVGHQGIYYPSGFMPVSCGQFPQDHVVTAYQEAPLMKSLRDSDSIKGKCGVCEYRKICGGSRARTLALTGDPMESEVDCVFEPSSAQQVD